MTPTVYATWAGHGKPQWFYLFSTPDRPEVDQEDPDLPGNGDVVAVRTAMNTQTGLPELVFRTRSRKRILWDPEVPFHAIVHCCPGEEDRLGDPHGLHTEDCAELRRRSDAYVLELARGVGMYPPAPNVQLRHCPTCTCGAR